jgi:hypothetical protein
MMERSWFWRRLAFYMILIVSLILFAWIVIFGADDLLRRESLQTVMIIILGAYGTYMTGAVLDDKFRDKATVAMKAVDQSAPATTETSVEVKQ